MKIISKLCIQCSIVLFILVQSSHLAPTTSPSQSDLSESSAVTQAITTQSPGTTQPSSDAATQSSTTTSQSATSTQSSTTQSLPRMLRETASVVPDGCTCRHTGPSNCTSLKEAIYNLYREIDLDSDKPYYVFTLKDLYYSGLLDGEEIGNELPDDLQSPPLNKTDFSTPFERDIADMRCERLTDMLEFPTRDASGYCSWSYRCTQNQLQFPSFQVEAVLDGEQPYEGECSPLSMENKRFVKTICEQEDASLPAKADWLECDCRDVTVAYRFEPNGKK